MTETGEPKTTGGGAPIERSFWDAFDRELAEINATLARLEKSVPPPSAEAVPAAPAKDHRPRREPRKRTTQPGEASKPDTAASQPGPAESPSTPPQPAPAATEPPPALPTGTDLADPKNFGMMPPVANLEQGTASVEDYRKRLGQDLAFANKVLHTSRVTAPVWREWRAFEKAAHERLRALAPPPPVEE